jgi:formate/nitrite transporter FocA (FNT family)
VPKELYEHIVEAGVVKSRWRLDRHIVMGLLAGFYIGFSFTVCMVIGGQVGEARRAGFPPD